MVALLAAALLATPAHAKELTSGEFRHTADTTEAGEIVLHPLFVRSSVGLTDNIDLKFPGVLAIVGGPMLGVEYAFSLRDDLKLSVEPTIRTGWEFDSFGTGVTGHLTRQIGTNRYNVSLGYGWHTSRVVQEVDGELVTTAQHAFTLPFHVGYDLVTSDRTTWRFEGSTDVLSLVMEDQLPYASVGASWNHAPNGGNFRLSLGLAVLAGENFLLDTLPEQALDELPGALTGPTLVIPAPTVELWWKI